MGDLMAWLTMAIIAGLALQGFRAPALLAAMILAVVLVIAAGFIGQLPLAQTAWLLLAATIGMPIAYLAGVALRLRFRSKSSEE